MWVALAFMSAFLLGCYDINKKMSLNGNAVIPVLFLNTLISSLIFVPVIILSYGTNLLDGSMLYVPHAPLEQHIAVFIKAVIVLSSWLFGYFAIKNLPLTITGPIKATQPVMTLLGALLIFGERLNLYQWIGVILSIISFFLLSLSGKKEGINFSHNKWIFFMILSAMLGALSGLYDKHLMRSLDVMTVQVWFNVYQCFIMVFILLFLWYPRRKKSTPFKWRWSIVFISVFLVLADWIYFYALSFPDSMISIVAMIRRSNVLVTFAAGALFFHEKNLKSKALDLLLVLIGMIFLYLGTK
ncbi:transporter family protein [Parabacteroides sp. PF5-5]|uniref:EamA family transporter n=1 Tax=unclassified Parabacteroides TaxID=2649774 RepID=UPI00247402C3|nr:MULTISPECIES: EamA family transporter [unclassified Parabacteroides]MDH6305083.1 transporter family protein [Parabacteroides sp. PH5-39]MDH6316433.1 transporter family protein [Parabacteroides sp. PF5-13]MDH6319943.1 transporter family protein [Parabacteroides sp. PH5-13]MDH6323824.1 transporter family protein [Parabacteroides sp. PH5-8]MDH6327620.1 transporter family protein [Parabacteroides sp. PH5-41]